MKTATSGKNRIAFDDVENGLLFLGFIDPPRQEAVTAIRDCRYAGIEVKMITGDHAATAVLLAVGAARFRCL